MRVLFVWSRNRRRSPTAEQIFSEVAGWQVMSAGLSPDAEEPVTPELIEWADVILVMEGSHRRKLTAQFAWCLRDKRIASLDIRDEYEFMQPELVALLQSKVQPLLPHR